MFWQGTVEAQNHKGEHFGFEFGRAMSMEPASAIARSAKSFGQQDDITVITVEPTALFAAVNGRPSDLEGAGTSEPFSAVVN